MQATLVPGPNSKFSKTVEVGWYCYELKLCLREIPTEKIWENQITENIAI